MIGFTGKKPYLFTESYLLSVFINIGNFSRPISHFTSKNIIIILYLSEVI